MQNNTSPSLLRVASYNIRKARGLDGLRNAGRIIDVINGLEADVVALQEADHRLSDRPAALPAALIATATDFDTVRLAANEVSLGWHGNAILLRKGVTVTSTSRISLPGLEPRGAVGVTLESGLTIVGTHLGLLRASRRKQGASIVAHLGDSGPTIVMGDMNEWSATRGLEPLHDRFKVHAPGRSFHAARPVASLDRIALSHDVTLADAGVDQCALARRASDHLPVWADITYLENNTGNLA